MNLLASNMIRQGFTSGLSNLTNGPSKRQFHYAAGVPSNLILNKTFENPNIFSRSTEKVVPSSYKHGDRIELGNALNSLKITEETLIPNGEEVQPENLEPKQTDCGETCELKIESKTDKMATGGPVEDVVMESDSDDSFIVFEEAESSFIIYDDENDSSSSEDEDCGRRSDLGFKSKLCRDRKESSTESEDSFIVFESEPNGDYDSSSEEEEERSESKRRRLRTISTVDSEDSFIVFGEPECEKREKKKCNNGKKVSFVEGPGLCTVHRMIKWSFAYKKARKGLWEQYGRDNARFKNRANLFGLTLNKYLQPEHRRKIYEERFKDRQD